MKETLYQGKARGEKKGKGPPLTKKQPEDKKINTPPFRKKNKKK